MISLVAAMTAGVTSPSPRHPSPHVCHLWLLACLLAATNYECVGQGDPESGRVMFSDVWLMVAHSLAKWLREHVCAALPTAAGTSAPAQDAAGVPSGPTPSSVGGETKAGSLQTPGSIGCTSDACDPGGAGIEGSSSAGATSSGGQSAAEPDDHSEGKGTIGLAPGTKPSDLAAAVAAGWMLVATAVPLSEQQHHEEGGEGQSLTGAVGQSSCDMPSLTSSQTASQTGHQSVSQATLLPELAQLVYKGSRFSAGSMMAEGAADWQPGVPPLSSGGWTSALYRFDVFGHYHKVGQYARSHVHCCCIMQTCFLHVFMNASRASQLCSSLGAVLLLTKCACRPVKNQDCCSSFCMVAHDLGHTWLLQRAWWLACRQYTQGGWIQARLGTLIAARSTCS